MGNRTPFELCQSPYSETRNVSVKPFPWPILQAHTQRKERNLRYVSRERPSVTKPSSSSLALPLPQLPAKPRPAQNPPPHSGYSTRHVRVAAAVGESSMYVCVHTITVISLILPSYPALPITPSSYLAIPKTHAPQKLSQNPHLPFSLDCSI